jgi:hypothetical protein
MEYFNKVRVAVKNKFGNHMVTHINVPSNLPTIYVFIRVIDMHTGRLIEAKLSGRGKDSKNYFYTEVKELNEG